MILGVPEGVRIVALLPLGYPAEEPFPRPRKPLGLNTKIGQKR